LSKTPFSPYISWSLFMHFISLQVPRCLVFASFLLPYSIEDFLRCLLKLFCCFRHRRGVKGIGMLSTRERERPRGHSSVLLLWLFRTLRSSFLIHLFIAVMERRKIVIESLLRLRGDPRLVIWTYGS
jgi:hypothetical protein